MLRSVFQLALACACLACIQHLPQLVDAHGGSRPAEVQQSVFKTHDRGRNGRPVIANRSPTVLRTLRTLLTAFNPSAAFSQGAVGASLPKARCRRECLHRPGVHFPQSSLSAIRMPLRQLLRMSDTEEDSDGDEMDWREMRARLVAQEKAEQQAEKGAENGTDDSSGYMYSSPLIEQGSVVLAGTKMSFGFALRQQYFHKAVMLLLQHDQFFTKGIILNRPTAYELDGWRVWCGGDVSEGGMFRGEANAKGEMEIVCLHALEGDMADLKSNIVIKGIAYTDFENAKDLIRRGLAKQTDFWVLVGYAGWGPQQLQREVDDRDSWYLAAADSGTLLQELLRQGTELPPPETGVPPGDGVATWETLMQRIGLSEEVERTRGELADRMLSEWCRMRLVPSKLREGKEVKNVSKASLANPTGMVLRTGSVSDRALLEDQFMHKSLMLVIGELQDDLLVVVLNRPTSNVVQLSMEDRPRRAIAYGGNRRVSVLGGGGQFDQNGLMWLSQSAKLEEANLEIGKELGNSGLRRVTAEEAVVSITTGKTDISDFLLVLGLNLFSREEMSSMLIRRELTVVDDARSLWPQVFELTEPKNLASEEGVSDGTSVWWAAGLYENKALVEQSADAAAAVEQSGSFDGALPVVQPTQLADDALTEWIKFFAY